MTDGNWVELTSAIGQLRQQLAEARELAEGEEVLFTVGKAEIELMLEIRKTAEGKAGFKFGIVSLEGKGSLVSATTHKLRLELLPHANGAGIDIADETIDLPHVPG
ncbi:trypco2 family protein [Saccharothrix stipae]